MARFCVTCKTPSYIARSLWRKVRGSYLTLVLLHVNLVSQDNEGEIFRIMWARLDEELIAPTVKCLERLGTVHVVYEDATVGTSVERHTERLEALLTGGVP